MTEQPNEYIISRDHAEEYAKLYAEANTADFAKMTEVRRVANDFLKQIRFRPVSTPPVPDSKHLIEMAKTEWTNREERRGIHKREDWCCGWMAGFLSVDKPDWSKEHDAAIAQRMIVTIKKKMGCMGEMKDWTQCHDCIFASEKSTGYYNCWLESLRQHKERL